MKHLLFALVLLLPAVPAAAQRYDCRLAANSETAWMPPQIIIDYNRAGSTAVVAHGWQQGPVRHAVDVDTSQDRMSFTVTNPARFNSRTAQVHYRMIFRFAQRTMSVSAQAGAGFEGNFRGTYGCAGG